MNPAFYALTHIGIALLLGALSIPLIRRRVPMNKFYGVRFPQSFQSDEAWYRINAFGGKCLVVASLAILFVGIYGLISAPVYYAALGSAVMLGSIGLAALVSYLQARKVGRELR